MLYVIHSNISFLHKIRVRNIIMVFQRIFQMSIMAVLIQHRELTLPFPEKESGSAELWNATISDDLILALYRNKAVGKFVFGSFTWQELMGGDTEEELNKYICFIFKLFQILQSYIYFCPVHLCFDQSIFWINSFRMCDPAATTPLYWNLLSTKQE
jgi:hypothetical protein